MLGDLQLRIIQDLFSIGNLKIMAGDGRYENQRDSRDNYDYKNHVPDGEICNSVYPDRFRASLDSSVW